MESRVQLESAKVYRARHFDIGRNRFDKSGPLCRGVEVLYGWTLIIYINKMNKYE